MKYELKRMTGEEANAFFASVKDADTAAIDISNGVVTTLGALASQYPLSDTRQNKAYLIFKHADVKKAEKWWAVRPRVEREGSVYTVLEGNLDYTDASYEGEAICSTDLKLYRIRWISSNDTMVPEIEVDQDNPRLDSDPVFDWDNPVSIGPIA